MIKPINVNTKRREVIDVTFGTTDLSSYVRKLNLSDEESCLAETLTEASVTRSYPIKSITKTKFEAYKADLEIYLG